MQGVSLRLAWSVTRYDGLISAEARDLQGRSISISTTRDGQPLGVKLISEKQILTCNAGRAGLDSLKVNPMTYGESMTVNPQAYGSTKQIRRLDTSKLQEMLRDNPELLKRYQELLRNNDK